MDTLVNPVSLVFASSLCFSIAEKNSSGIFENAKFFALSGLNFGIPFSNTGSPSSSSMYRELNNSVL